VEDSDLDRVRRAAVRRCLRAGASPDEAEDAVQEAFLAGLRATGSPLARQAWVNTVAHWRHVDRIRREMRERSSLRRQPDANRPVPGPEDRVVDAAMASWLVTRLCELPPVTRSVCSAVGQGLSRAEIAHDLEISARSVESHLDRARRYLRRLSVLGALLAVVGSWLSRQFAAHRASAVVAAAPVGMTALVLLPSLHDEVVDFPALGGPPASTVEVIEPVSPGVDPLKPGVAAPALRQEPPEQDTASPSDAAVPESTNGDSAVPDPALLDLALPQLTLPDLALPEPVVVNPAVPNLALRDRAVPQPTLSHRALPQPTHVDPAAPNPTLL